MATIIERQQSPGMILPLFLIGITISYAHDDLVVHVDESPDMGGDLDENECDNEAIEIEMPDFDLQQEDDDDEGEDNIE